VPIRNGDMVAIDDLGRAVPGHDEVGDPKSDRVVGLFFWQWHQNLRHMPGDWNMTEHLKKNPGKKFWEAKPKDGPAHPTYYWAEPIWGYYRSDDPWVVRRQLQMIALAGVDFLFLDYTNASTYDAQLTLLLETARELKAQGVAVPKVVVFLNHQPDWKVEHLYLTFYKPGQWDDLWFRWRGKPLILTGKPDATKFKNPDLAPEVESYFTFRRTWALHDPAKEPTRWRFMDHHPQRPAKDEAGNVEQMVVSKGLGGPLNQGHRVGSVSATPGNVPTYDDQWLSGNEHLGLFFAEQWKQAHRVAAPVLLVTGWNEWHASVWERPGVPMFGEPTKAGQGYLVDQFNMEFNRDLEPMTGGYHDVYYWQFVSEMRRYKGMTGATPPSPRQTIDPSGPASQWDDVQPRFVDFQGDVDHRDHAGNPKDVHYRNDTGRNDIALTQVARDTNSVVFRIATAKPLSPASDPQWMQLFIDADDDPKTGWHGYDLLVNRTRAGGTASIERHRGDRDAFAWTDAGQAVLHVEEQAIVLALPRRLFGPGRLAMRFKVADHLPETPTIMDFYTSGDASPDTRWNWRFAEPVN
jgi:hypothetical protein